MEQNSQTPPKGRKQLAWIGCGRSLDVATVAQILSPPLQHCLSFLVTFKKPQTGGTAFHCGGNQTKLKASHYLSL